MLYMPEKKRRKKKKNSDKAWNPRQNAARRDFSSFTTETLLRFMRTASSPAKKAVILNSTKSDICQGEKVLSTPTGKHASQLLSPSGYTLSTPEAGPKTSHLITHTGSKLLPSRVMECDDGFISVFLSEDKVIKKELNTPLKPKAWIQHSPIPEVSMDGMIDIPITKKQIKQVEALTRKRRQAGENPRGISQNTINKIPATKAMRKAGIDVEDGDGHYVHFIPFSFLGDDAQKVENMGIGTRYANAAMELVNPAIRRLLYLKNGPKVVYLSAIPEWVPGFEKIRLLKSITYIIKDGKGNDFKHSAKVVFNTLSLREVCLTDVRPIKESIIAKFAEERPEPAKASQCQAIPKPHVKVIKSTGLLSPTIKNAVTPMGAQSSKKQTLDVMSNSYGSPSNPTPSPILVAYRQSSTRFAGKGALFPSKENEIPIRKLNFKDI